MRVRLLEEGGAFAHGVVDPSGAVAEATAVGLVAGGCGTRLLHAACVACACDICMYVCACRVTVAATCEAEACDEPLSAEHGGARGKDEATAAGKAEARMGLSSQACPCST